MNQRHVRVKGQRQVESMGEYVAVRHDTPLLHALRYTRLATVGG